MASSIAPTAARQHTVLVTDGDQRSALASVRSMGRAGHRVIVCSSNGESLAGASRFAAADYAVADALEHPAEFVRNVQRLVREHGVTTMLPITEASLLALLPARADFGSVLIPFANLDAFQAISNKEAVLEAAQRVGIAIPAQTVVHRSSDVTPSLLDSLQYPLVVKPARSVSEGANGRIKLTVVHAADRNELQTTLAEMDPAAYPLLLQQRVVGPGIGVFLLVWNGETVAAFSHRRIREKPPAGGISVYRESTPLDSALAAKSRALLDAFGWQGVAMVEYKVDKRTGTPYLMEINGRFWGSLQLAIDAGVNFPQLLVAAASGERPTPVTSYDTNVRSRWFFGDLDHVLIRLRNSARALALPPGSPGKFATVRAFCARDGRDRDEIRQSDDPEPFRRERAQYLSHLIGR
jgi:predicted ATP-grasp superfamily ATP-dependent carboligase